MKIRTLQIAIMAVALVIAVQARASVVGNVTVSPANSVDISWTDGNYGGPIDALEAIIVSGNGATFDLPVTVTDPGWSGVLLNSTATFAAGPANANNQTITLSFADSLNSLTGVMVDFYYWDAGNALPQLAWQWLNLPTDVGYTQGIDWQYLTSANPAEPSVPEPTTMIAGALLLLPFGASTLRILRKNRAA
jgi:hypothetical protein